MRLLKIGRDDHCTIVIKNPTVSSLHAEIIISDDLSMKIIDKNSTNGTTVNGQLLAPNTPKGVKIGDVVRFGNAQLNWADINPYLIQIPNSKKYSEIINIGSDNLNDIQVIGDQSVSRFHAYLLKNRKDKKWYIRDNGSTNGVTVNGHRIRPNVDTRLTRKDTVIAGNADITEQIGERIFHRMDIGKWIWWAAGGLVTAACVAFVLWVVGTPKQEDWNPEQAVVYVDASYHYQLKFDPKTLPIDKDVWQSVLGKNAEYGIIDIPMEKPYSATAFFLDRNGYLATNRHVALPWESEDSNQSDKDMLGEIWDVRTRNLPQVDGSNMETLMNYDPFWKIMIDLARVQTVKYGNSDYYTMNKILNKLKNVRPEVTGVLDYISVGYRGRHYTHQDEFDRCYVVSTSDSPDKDVALLQLNTKKTPDDIKDVFTMDRIYDGELKPVEMTMRWEGYPRGMSENLDRQTHSLEPQIRETTIGKVPSKYSFELQGEVGPGASGSPVYNPGQDGKWYGIVWGMRGSASTYTMASQAKYVRQLYENEVGN